MVQPSLEYRFFAEMPNGGTRGLHRAPFPFISDALEAEYRTRACTHYGAKARLVVEVREVGAWERREPLLITEEKSS